MTQKEIDQLQEAADAAEKKWHDLDAAFSDDDSTEEKSADRRAEVQAAHDAFADAEGKVAAARQELYIEERKRELESGAEPQDGG